MLCQFNLTHPITPIFFLLDIHSNLVPKQTTVTIKNYKHLIFMEYAYFKNNNKEEILVTILPTKGVIRIKC